MLGKLERTVDFPEWVRGILSHTLINPDVHQCLKTEKEVSIQKLMMDAWRSRQLRDLEQIDNMVETLTGKKP